MSWRGRVQYERGEGRHKHRWKNDYAGFVPGKRGPIGKCHRSIDQATAERLLKSGFAPPSPYGDDEDPPEVVYNVYRGIPYLAVPTQPGSSYHGYPWRGRMAASVKNDLRARAERSGHLKEFQKWLKKYES